VAAGAGMGALALGSSPARAAESGTAESGTAESGTAESVKKSFRPCRGFGSWPTCLSTGRWTPVGSILAGLHAPIGVPSETAISPWLLGWTRPIGPLESRPTAVRPTGWPSSTWVVCAIRPIGIHRTSVSGCWCIGNW